MGTLPFKSVSWENSSHGFITCCKFIFLFLILSKFKKLLTPDLSPLTLEQKWIKIQETLPGSVRMNQIPEKQFFSVFPKSGNRYVPLPSPSDQCPP